MSSISQPSCPESLSEQEGKEARTGRLNNEGVCECSNSAAKNDEDDLDIDGRSSNETRPLSLSVSPIKVTHEVEYLGNKTKQLQSSIFFQESYSETKLRTSSFFADYHSIALTMHNHYRFLHGSPPLELNDF